MGDTEEKRSYHEVSWDIMTKGKTEGGLGLRKLIKMNKVCGMKLVSNLINGDEELWSSVLKNKYKVANMMGCT